MERYAVKTDNDSGIKNDPNVFAEKTDNLQYILDLLLRIITISMWMMDIVDQLTKVTFTEKEKVLAGDIQSREYGESHESGYGRTLMGSSRPIPNQMMTETGEPMMRDEKLL